MLLGDRNGTLIENGLNGNERIENSKVVIY